MTVKISAAISTGNWTDEMTSEEEAIQLAEDLISDIEAMSNERFTKFHSAAWKHYWKSNFGHTIRITVVNTTALTKAIASARIKPIESTRVGVSQYFAD